MTSEWRSGVDNQISVQILPQPFACPMFLSVMRLTPLLPARGLALAMVLAAPAVPAGQFALEQGRTQTLQVLADVRNALQQCHLRIDVEGQPPLQRTVQAPRFAAAIEVSPTGNDPLRVRWQGQATRDARGEVINPCPTAGEALYPVLPSLAPLRAPWQAWLASRTPAMAACLRMGLPKVGVDTERFDLRDPQSSVGDARIRSLEADCERFVALPRAWGTQDETRHACTLAGGQRTFCEGVYRLPAQGRQRGQQISAEQAFDRHQAGLAFVTEVREHTLTRQAREQRLAREKARAEAEEAARIQAETAAREREEAERVAREQAEVQARKAAAEAARKKAEEDKARAEEERKARRNAVQRLWEDEVMGRLKGASE